MRTLYKFKEVTQCHCGPHNRLTQWTFTDCWKASFHECRCPWELMCLFFEYCKTNLHENILELLWRLVKLYFSRYHILTRLPAWIYLFDYNSKSSLNEAEGRGLPIRDKVYMVPVPVDRNQKSITVLLNYREFYMKLTLITKNVHG